MLRQDVRLEFSLLIGELAVYSALYLAGLLQELEGRAKVSL